MYNLGFLQALQDANLAKRRKEMIPEHLCSYPWYKPHLAYLGRLEGEAPVKANLSEADLSGTYLSGVVLSGAYLTGANLHLASLRGADLSEAKLTGADLSEADLSGTKLREAILRVADLSGADLSRADLSGADLSNASLGGANLAGANLTGANLREVNLTGAKLEGADLTGADLSWTTIAGADLTGVSLQDAKVPAFSFSRAKALNEGILKDVPSAKELGFTCPVAISQGAWADSVAWGRGNVLGQSEKGRLQEVLSSLGRAIGPQRPSYAGRFGFRVSRIPDKPRFRAPRESFLQALVHSGDQGELVLTIFLPSEASPLPYPWGAR